MYLNQQGYETHSCAMSKYGPGAEVADHFSMIDVRDISGITKYIRQHEIDAVYSVGSDIAMPVACKISEELRLPHFVSSRAAILCTNKSMMRKKFTGESNWSIPFQSIKDKEVTPKIPFPFITKPADSQGQRGITLVKTMEDYQNAYQQARYHSRSNEVIIEKYVYGCEVSVNAYLVDGTIQLLIVSERKTWPQFTGLVHKHILNFTGMTDTIYQAIVIIVKESCRQMGISDGPVYYQMKIENSKPYLIEMTPRLDGCHLWKLIRYYAGIDLLKLTFDHLLKGDVTELGKADFSTWQFEEVFFCQEPGTIMERKTFHVPDSALEYVFYYQSGETIRAINHQYEKVGFYIQKLERKPS